MSEPVESKQVTANGGGDASVRTRKPTEKGLQHQLDAKLKVWKSSITKWRMLSNKLRELLVEDDVESSVIKDCRDNLQSAMDNVISVQESLAELSSSMNVNDGSEEKLDEIEEEHSSLMKDTLKMLLALRGEMSSHKGTSRLSVSSTSQRLCQEWVDDSRKVNSPKEKDITTTRRIEEPTDDPEAASHKNTHTSSHHKEEVALASSLTELLCLNRLPIPEPGVFDGNPLEYTSWKRSYDALIEHRGIPAGERFYFLLKYLKGAPLVLVKGYSMLGDDAAYVEAMKVLQERYGNPFVISNAFRDKLDDWPKISPKDYLGLRRFGDFLHQCCTAARYVHHLHHLDDERENKKLMSKLPDWLITRWGRNVVKWRQDRGSFPPFSVFTAFISDEADIACDPITSNQTSLKDRRQQSSNVRTLSTSVQGQQANGGKGKWKPLCTYCKGEHHLATCKSFMSQTLDHRTKFVFDHGLCFGCLRSGHLSKNCKKRSSCSTCKRRHPTVLHDENWTERQQSKRVEIKNEAEETQTTRSHASTMKDNHKSLKTSTIVPVWLSHESVPGERLVYAMLDTQSDTSFILDRTKEAMGIEGIAVNLLLSTMTLANERISSEKISGLKVRAFNGREEICLPPTYTRNIMPANREHIPTPDIAKAHPHLNDIAKHLIPLQDCEIGLLIGYDCASALCPRAVISSPDHRGSFGLQTDLGWSIVGTIEPNSHVHVPDRARISHRVLVQAIPEESQKDDLPTTISVSHQSRFEEEITPIARPLEADFAPEKRQMSDSRNDFKMECQVHPSEVGHCDMPLPFCNENSTLQSSEVFAEKRLGHLQRKSKTDPASRKHFMKQMITLLNINYEEEEERPSKEGEVCYIDHLGLRFTGVLCRFRRDVLAFKCDLKERFRQFQLNKEHRINLQFLWWLESVFLHLIN